MRHSMIGVALVSLALLIPQTVQAGNTDVTLEKTPAGIVHEAPPGVGQQTMFWLDTPPEDAVVAGLVEVAGWIVDPRGVSNIDLYVDGVYFASADINKPRYDVVQAYPWVAASAQPYPGFSTSFDADSLTNGAHTIFLRVTFSDSTTEDFGNRSVTVNKEINQAPFGELELPGPAQPMDSVFPVSGWALDDGEVTKVEILVDGQVIGGAELGVPRPDVQNRFPSDPAAGTSGFIRMLNTTKFTNGVHTLAVRLWDDEGASRVIGQRFVQVFNNGRNLAPFGRIEWPIENHYIGVYCEGDVQPGEPGWSAPPGWEPDPVDPTEWEWVSGWVLDVGSRSDLGGVASVELLIDGVSLAKAPVDQFYLDFYQRYVNTLGIERIDIHRLFPDVPASKDSGYILAVNVVDLLYNKGFRQGLHWLTVRATDFEGYSSKIGTIPVIITCGNCDTDCYAFGDIYTPVNMERVAGTYPVTGWAIDFQEIQRVEIYVDGKLMGVAQDHLDSPELMEAQPWWPACWTEDAGFAYDLDTTMLTDGEHYLVVRSIDRQGNENFVGQRTFIVDNLND